MSSKRAKSKFIGMIFDGRWEVKERIVAKSGHGIFKLVNIYNNNEIFVYDTDMTKLAQGKITVSKIMSNKLKREQIYTIYKY